MCCIATHLRYSFVSSTQSGGASTRVWGPRGERGGLGQSPHRGPGAQSLVRVAWPPEAERLFASSQPEESANCFLYNKTISSDVWGPWPLDPPVAVHLPYL